MRSNEVTDFVDTRVFDTLEGVYRRFNCIFYVDLFGFFGVCVVYVFYYYNIITTIRVTEEKKRKGKGNVLRFFGFAVPQIVSVLYTHNDAASGNHS